MAWISTCPVDSDREASFREDDPSDDDDIVGTVEHNIVKVNVKLDNELLVTSVLRRILGTTTQRAFICVGVVGTLGHLLQVFLVLLRLLLLLLGQALFSSCWQVGAFSALAPLADRLDDCQRRLLLHIFEMPRPKINCTRAPVVEASLADILSWAEMHETGGTISFASIA